MGASSNEDIKRIVDMAIEHGVNVIDTIVSDDRTVVPIIRYQISSTTSISRSKAALIKNDILDNKAGEISFQDPIYAYWLKTEFFAK